MGNQGGFVLDYVVAEIEFLANLNEITLRKDENKESEEIWQV